MVLSPLHSGAKVFLLNKVVVQEEKRQKLEEEWDELRLQWVFPYCQRFKCVKKWLVLLLNLPWQRVALSPFVDIHEIKLQHDPTVLSSLGLLTEKAQSKYSCTFSTPADSTVAISFQVLYPHLVFVTRPCPCQISQQNTRAWWNTVLSMDHPQGVSLHSTQSLFAACVVAALHTECQTFGMEKNSCTLWSSHLSEWSEAELHYRYMYKKLTWY